MKQEKEKNGGIRVKMKFDTEDWIVILIIITIGLLGGILAWIQTWGGVV